jgi:hypothetical protein
MDAADRVLSRLTRVADGNVPSFVNSGQSPTMAIFQRASVGAYPRSQT